MSVFCLFPNYPCNLILLFIPNHSRAPLTYETPWRRQESHAGAAPAPLLLPLFRPLPVARRSAGCGSAAPICPLPVVVSFLCPCCTPACCPPSDVARSVVLRQRAVLLRSASTARLEYSSGEPSSPLFSYWCSL
jgi:hypothetical protein